MELPLRQTRFSNGEISKPLYGEVRHPKWADSLRTCRNWLPVPQGPITKRPGGKYGVQTKDMTAKGRLIPFVFSDGAAYVLEFGNLFVRVYQQFTLITELVTPWYTAMLPYLKYTQVGNVMTVVYGGQAGAPQVAPRDIRRGAPWTITATPTSIPAGAVVWPGSVGIGIPIWTALITFNKGDRCLFTDAAAVPNTLEWVSLQDGNLNNSPPAPAAPTADGTGIQGTLFWTPVIDRSHFAQKNLYVQTAVVQDANGVTYESAPNDPKQYQTPVDTDRPLAIIPRGGGSLSPPTLAAGYSVVYYRLYKSTGGTYGWIKDFVVSAATMVTVPGVGGLCVMDNGIDPDLTQQPPQATDPFLFNGADSYPSVVGYLDQRRLFAASLAQPQLIVLSKDGDLYNYDKTIPGTDADAIYLTAADQMLQQARGFAALRRGIVLTGQGEFVLSGSNGSPISRSNKVLQSQSAWGSSWLDPIKVGNGILFNTAKSDMVRDLFPLYGTYTDIWDGQDVSFMARHLLERSTLASWAYQTIPYPVIWQARSDGLMVTLTYQHAPPSFGQQLAEGIAAWAWHDTGIDGADAVESFCVVPEPPEDAVYMIVKRTFNNNVYRYIERMSSPLCPASPYDATEPDVRYGIYLDCAIRYDGHNDQIPFTQYGHIDSVLNPGSTDIADYAAESLITVTLDAAGLFSALDADASHPSQFVADPEDTLGLGVFHATIIGFTSSAVVTAKLIEPLTQAQLDAWRAGQNVWGLAKSRITAAHLNGATQDSGTFDGARGVHVLADGNPVDPAAVTWAGGVALLTDPALVICIGLAYNSDAESLDAYHPSAEIRNKFKTLKRVGFEVAESRGLWVGQSLDNLFEWEQRTVDNSYDLLGLETGYAEEFVTGEWDKAGRLAIRHFDPLPCTILGLLREIDLGNS